MKLTMNKIFGVCAHDRPVTVDDSYSYSLSPNAGVRKYPRYPISPFPSPSPHFPLAIFRTISTETSARRLANEPGNCPSLWKLDQRILTPHPAGGEERSRAMASHSLLRCKRRAIFGSISGKISSTFSSVCRRRSPTITP